MKERRSPFFAFRYLVTPIDNQISITQGLNKGKEDLMRDLILDLHQNNKTEWYKGQKKIFVEGEDDIELKKIKEAKFIFLIIDIKHQIILIERNTTVFSSVQNAVNILADYFRGKMKHFDYVVNIYPLVSKTSFWKYVDDADEIFELNLVLNAPNLPFLGYKNTRQALNQIKETTNNEEFEIGLRNKEGKLKIIQESLGGWINYVREVGGKYLIKFSKNGVFETKTSYDDTAKIYIKRNKNEKFTSDELNNIETKINLMHNLEGRSEEDSDG